MLLTNAGLYKLALSTATAFELPYRQVFDSLTKRCCSLSKQSDSLGWGWLTENDLQDLPGNAQTASTTAWSLLLQCLEKYEEDKMSSVHKTICKQIIKQHMWIPQALLASYKERNPAELFRLLYNSGRLEEAADLAGEYMKAALGYGKEYYGFRHSVQPIASSVCLPIRGFVNLIDQLKQINETDPEQPFLKQHSYLTKVLDTYLKIAQRASNDMCQYQMNVTAS